jgi:hypothetical protein
MSGRVGHSSCAREASARGLPVRAQVDEAARVVGERLRGAPLLLELAGRDDQREVGRQVAREGDGALGERACELEIAVAGRHEHRGLDVAGSGRGVHVDARPRGLDALLQQQIADLVGHARERLRIERAGTSRLVGSRHRLRRSTRERDGAEDRRRRESPPRSGSRRGGRVDGRGSETHVRHDAAELAGRKARAGTDAVQLLPPHRCALVTPAELAARSPRRTASPRTAVRHAELGGRWRSSLILMKWY